MNNYNIKISNFDTKYYYLNNLLHRENIPEIEWYDGHKVWHLNSKCYGKGDDFINEYWVKFINTLLLS